MEILELLQNVAQKDTREVIDIAKLNMEIDEIVAQEWVLRDEIAKSRVASLHGFQLLVDSREESMDQSFLQSIHEIVTTIDWSAWVTAVATIVLAVLTFVYVRLTGKILSAQSDPCVILTVVHDEERATILQLVARNVGKGLAQDIRFEFSRPLPAKAFGLSKSDAKESIVMADGPLIDGIPALGPGECRKVDWGQYDGLVAALGNKAIIATCKFKKNGKDMLPTQCPLDVTSFVGTVAVESSSAKTVKVLEKLSKNINQLASDSHKLKVEVVSLPQDKDNGKNA